MVLDVLLSKSSVAVTVISLKPLFNLTFPVDQLVVPDAVPDPPNAFNHVMLLMPEASDALPRR